MSSIEMTTSDDNTSSINAKTWGREIGIDL